MSKCLDMTIPEDLIKQLMLVPIYKMIIYMSATNEDK